MRVIAVLDSLTPGGTETSTVLLGSQLLGMGVDFSILTLRDTEPDLSDMAAEAGVEVRTLESSSAGAQLLELRRIIRAQRPDIVHTALFQADQLGRLGSAFTGSTVVSSLVNTPYVAARLADPNVVGWKLQGAQMLDAITSRLFVDRFHAVSEGVKSESIRALRLPASRVNVVERGRDPGSLEPRTPERQRQARASLGFTDEEAIILNIGRQEFQKGQLDLVKASGLLAQQGRRHRVLIAGKPGNATDALTQRLGEPGSVPAVTLLGQREDVPHLLTAADVLVISSHFEGTAGVALEAMAIGTPIVSTDLVGIRGVLAHERNALLVPVGQPARIAGSVGLLLDDRVVASELTLRGQHDFAERFTLERSATLMYGLYRSVTDGHTQRCASRRFTSHKVSPQSPSPPQGAVGGQSPLSP